MKAIELLLVDTVENLGIVGDVVKVRPGYARNFLLPRALAIPPSKGAIARLAEKRKEVEAQMKLQRAQREALLERLAGLEITIERSANEQGILFGGVSQHDIAKALQAEGYQVDDRAVRIGEQIKRLDSYQIPITLANDLKTQIKLWVVSDKPAESQEEAQGEAQADEQSSNANG